MSSFSGSVAVSLRSVPSLGDVVAESFCFPWFLLDHCDLYLSPFFWAQAPRRVLFGRFFRGACFGLFSKSLSLSPHQFQVLCSVAEAVDLMVCQGKYPSQLVAIWFHDRCKRTHSTWVLAELRKHTNILSNTSDNLSAKHVSFHVFV